MKYTYEHQYQAHYGVKDRSCTVPDQVANAQKEYDGHTFPVIRDDNRKCRARLDGEAYDLWGPGTGDMIVIPV